MTQENLMISIDVLRKEVEVLTSRLRPAGTGYLHTAIDVLNSRIDELIEEVTAPYFEDEDVYDGYKEHTEAMEQARLRKIQDTAAGKPNSVRDAYLYSSKVKDDYEHTDDYYDTERNRPVDEGLSDRSQFLRTMKRKHGQAVMTTSEMMQEELEPLPINISK